MLEPELRTLSYFKDPSLTPAERSPSAVFERTASLGGAWATVPADSMMVLQQRVNDASPHVRAEAVLRLTAVVALAPPVERVELVYRWVLSSKVEERAGIAAALCNSIPVLASDLAIEYLAQDSEPRVRALAALAAAHRFREAPRAYQEVLSRLVADPDRRVRSVASPLLKALGKG